MKNRDSDQGPDEKGFSIPEDCDFGNVEELYIPNECSPEITDPDFTGIVINAPKQVFFTEGASETPFGGFANVPVCGTYAHNLGTPLDSEESFEDGLVFVAVNARTNKPYAGKIRSLDIPIPEPESEEDEEELDLEDLSGRTIIGYFNPNLTEVLELPAEEAEYIVYVTLGPYKSNVVRIKVTRRE